MNRRLALFAVVAALAAFVNLSTVNGDEDRPIVNVQVYYESLCPDSKYFIVSRLAPFYNQSKDFLNVDLIPFGKASWVDVNGGLATEFTCQHGPEECSGNIAQACALDEIEKSEPEEAARQQRKISVVTCAMASRDPVSAVPACSERHGLSDESIQRIVECTEGPAGVKLLKANGVKTRAVGSPGLSFVPTVVVNGEKSMDAFTHFSTVVCQQIPSRARPEACRL